MSQTPSTAVPRPLTIHARRQASRELPVRVWTLATSLLILIICGVAIHEISQSLADRALLAQGVRVLARIDVIAGGTRNADRSVPQQVTMSFMLPGETERRVLDKVMLAPSPNGGLISKGDTIPILVHPQHINTWTDRVEPESWLVVLATPLLLTPVAIIFAGVAMLRLSSTKRLFENGSLVTAVASELHRSALLPGQKIVRLSVGGGKVLSAALPDPLGPIGVGEAVEVIVDDAANPRRALIARAYGLTS